MVVKIKPATGGMATAIEYNERKVSKGDAEVVCRENMDTERDNAVRETFSRYERLNIRSREVCFHMSINPGPGEVLEDSKARGLTAEIMESLGYGEQPYVLYRHNDIEREHYHVLSIRVNERGRKIKSFQEQNRLQRFLGTVSEKYGFSIGNPEREALKERGITPRLFDYRSGNISAQLDAVFEECLKYHFTSFSQFEQILLDHNVAIKLSRRKLYLQGMDFSGRKCTVPVSKLDFHSRMLDRMQESVEEVCDKAAARVARTGATLLPYSKSENHYVNMMLKKNIHASFGKDSHGRIDSALFIDHESRGAYTDKDMGHELSISMIQDADKNQWDHSESHHTSINIGEMLFAPGGGSKAHEKDPKYKKKKSSSPHF